MAEFNKIAIIGVGLIGGSIGLAIKKNRQAREVIGIFRRKSTLKKALKRGAVDRGVMDIDSGVKDADLIIIAAPVHLIPPLAEKVLKIAKPGAIITDAGSTKGWIVGAVEKMLGRSTPVHFVGSHPMAGSEHVGVEFAVDDLFQGAACIVTKTPRTNRKSMVKVVLFWKSLGSRVKVMSPAEHDRTVSLVSHLPHVVAFSLAGAVPRKEISCAAEGFRDTTRVASSDPELWADIFLTNREAILNAGRAFSKNYTNLLRAISRNDRRMTVDILKNAKRRRDALANAKKS